MLAAPAALDPAALSVKGKGTVVVVGRATSEHRPSVFTRELTVSRFGAAGVSWVSTGKAADVIVQVRIRERGLWSAWQSLDEADGPEVGSKDAVRAGSRVATEPITSAFADGIQVRVDSASSLIPTDLELTTVDPGVSSADAVVPAALAAANPAGKPSIITRAQWGADESMRDCSPSYSDTIKAGIVHHTVNSNNYQPADSAALVRAIYAYHVNGNGWCDIGYNFLVDRYGQIFEGRYGGVDSPVIGAQAGGFNTYTFGVSGIGDFTSVTPTPQMLAAYAAVLGWKLSLHGVDPQSTTVLVSGGGPYTQWPAGTPVTVRAVLGHRDVDATGCPGDALYPQLGSLASRVRSYIATTSPASLWLNSNQGRTSPDGRYRLVMQADGNLVVYGPSGPVWASGTTVPYSYTVVQGDGNLVMYDRTDGSVRWATNTSGLYTHLEMQNDGNLVLYTGSGGAIWDWKGNTGRVASVFPATKTLFGSLNETQRVYSPSGSFFLIMQGDGNLVEYDRSGRARWASGTTTPGSRLVFQADGNLVVYTAQGRPVWSSATYGNPGAFAMIHDDGQLTVYATNGARLWVA